MRCCWVGRERQTGYVHAKSQEKCKKWWSLSYRSVSVGKCGKNYLPFFSTRVAAKIRRCTLFIRRRYSSAASMYMSTYYLGTCSTQQSVKKSKQRHFHGLPVRKQLVATHARVCCGSHREGIYFMHVPRYMACTRSSERNTPTFTRSS